MKRSNRTKAWVAILTVLMMLVVSACSSGGISQDELDAVQADLDAATAELETANADITALQAQVGSAAAAQTIVQTASLAAPIEAVAIGADGWTNEESVRGGLSLVATFDSSGPDAWDIAAHPRVYYTSESYASNFFSGDEGDAKLEALGLGNFIGYHVIDVDSRQVIASGLYELNGNIVRGPHGVGVSPDGQWVYVGWTEEDATDQSRSNYVGIIKAQTMKLDKILKQESYFQGGMRGQALHHIQGWTDADGNDYVILQWGFGANGGPHHILSPNDNNSVFRSITYDDVKPMGHPFTTPSPDGQWVYVSMGANWIRASHSPTAGIAKVNVQTGEVIEIEGVGWHPIGITHTQDGLWTYVVDGHSSHVYKIDNETNEVVGETSAGVAGPYGICLNKDETKAYTVGKGEGTHNVGDNLGIIDLARFRSTGLIYLGGSASSVDHCALNPDLDSNEIWVSDMKGWETIIVDDVTDKVLGYVATPHGGDTHGMAFVYYDGGWDNGELMVDMGGPKSKDLQAEILGLAEAAAADG